MLSAVVAFTFICLSYSAVEATYGLYPEYSGSFSSLLGQSHSDWIPLSSSYNKYSNPYINVYDTLNSEYSHALYPIGHHVFRIPVKGGLTVVPAPNLNSYKGISSYGGHSNIRTIPLIKTTPLNYYSSHLLKSSDLSLLSQPRFISTHGLNRGIYSKSIQIPRYSSKQLDNSHLEIRGHKLLGNIKGIHGLSLSSPILRSYKHTSPIISSHHEPTEHIHGNHEISHIHESDIAHGLTHSHHSDIGHRLSHIHSSDIVNQHQPIAILYSTNNIHGSTHAVIDHEDSDDIVDHDDIDDGHYTPLHKSHLHEDTHSYLDGEIVSHADKEDGHLISSHHKTDEILVDDKEDYPKDSGKEYVEEYEEKEHIEEDNRDIKDEKYDQKPLRLPHKEDLKSPSQGYVEQKKLDHPRINIQKEAHNTYQENKHRSRQHHIKGYAKPLVKFPIHRQPQSYPQFPPQPKHDSLDIVKYAGGRHPVRPTADNLEQTYFNSEHVSKNDDIGSARHPSYEAQQKIEQQEQLHEDEYKPSAETSYKPSPYRKPHDHIQKQRSPHYKSDSVQPRGRTKIYRNYEEPRTSSYEIEILHSDSSDQTVENVKNSDGSSEDSNKDINEAFLTEETSDDFDGFDSEESQQSITEEKNESEEQATQNSENQE